MKKALLFLLLLAAPLHASRLFVRSNGDVMGFGNTGAAGAPKQLGGAGTASSTITEQLSFSVWCRLAGISDSNYLVSNAASTGLINYSFGYQATAWRAVFTTGFITFIVYSFTDLTPGTGWHHIVFTIDLSTNPDSVAFYLDGTVQTLSLSGSNNIDPDRGTTPLTVAGLFGANFQWNGDLSQMALWNRVLNQGEVTALFRGAQFDRIGPPEGYELALPLQGLFDPEPDWSRLHFHSSSITGTSRGPEPATVPRY